MGIPVFFKTLITDYSHVIKPISSQSVDCLFFDLNCLIHPCCAKVDNGNEQEMITLIINTIHKLIKLTGASFVYIAIDGPAPKAKMIQQRSRRHKSVLENKPWDTNAITPGTTFMNKLNEALHKEFNQSTTVISDSMVPGEGEHKILQYIKQNNDVFQKKRCCIYGLDADLIVLSLVSGLKDIVLLRERTSFNIEQMDCEYLYLDINALKKEVLNEFPKLNITKQTLINDYCFICFLLGNDFMKHSPSLILRYDGLYHLIQAYKRCQEKHNHKFYLINTKTKSIIHWNHFKLFIQELTTDETERMFDIYKIRLKQHAKYKRIYNNIQQNKNSVKATNSPNFAVEDIMRHKPIIFMDDEKIIFKTKDLWYKRYNTYTISESHQDMSVNDLSIKTNQVCFAYLQSLVWTSHYYFSSCISQEWYYPFEFSPTLHDLSNYLQTNKRVTVKPCFDICSTKQQLQFIFPKQSYHLSDELTDKLKDNSELDDFTGFTKYYSLLKRYDWECEPIIESN